MKPRLLGCPIGLIVSAFVALSGCTSGVLEAELIACPIVEKGEAGPICVLTEEKSIKILVRSNRGLRIRQGKRELKEQKSREILPGLRELTVIPAFEDGNLVVSQRTLFWRKERVLPLRTWKQPRWFTEAARLWDEGKPEKALAEIPPTVLDGQQAESPQALRDHLYALSLKARIDASQYRVDPAKDSYKNLLSKVRQAGQVSLELTTILELAMLYFDRLGKPNDAASLLAENQREELAKKYQPEMLAWFELHKALYKQRLGDIKGALHHTELGLQSANRYPSPYIHLDLHNLRSDLFHTLEKQREAAQEETTLTKLLADEPAPCWHAYTLADRGLSRLQIREMGGDIGHPREPLLQALRLCEKECSVIPLAEVIASRLARVELQDERILEAERWLDLAKSLVAQPMGTVAIERAELSAEISLRKGKNSARQALETFREMLALSQKDNSFEHSFRAMLGEARALESLGENRQSVFRAYDRAAAYQNARGPDMPQSGGSRSLIFRHERATRHIVEGHAQADPDKAMKIARLGRRRLLALASVPLRSKSLQGQDKDRWDAAMTKYRNTRDQLDHFLKKEASHLAAKEYPEAEELRTKTIERLEKELDNHLAEALRVLNHNLDEGEDLREPGEGEALLLCYPGSKDTNCFLKKKSGTKLVLVPKALSRNTGLRFLETEIIAKFQKQLVGVQRLYVLPGHLHNLDVHRVPLAGKPIEDQMEVRYSLDLPPRQKPKDFPRKAIVVSDLLGSEASRPIDPEALAQGLRISAGWQVEGFSGVKIKGIELREKLREPFGLLLIYGETHTVQGSAKGSGEIEMRTADGTGLRARDVFACPAPIGGIILACESAVSTEEAAGPEGIPLAHAYLMMGAHFTIGTARVVDPMIAHQVALELTAVGAEKIIDDPSGQLQQVLRSIAQKGELLAKEKSAQNPMQAALSLARLRQELPAYRVYYP